MSTQRKQSVLSIKDSKRLFHVWRKAKKEHIYQSSLKSTSSRSHIYMYAKPKRKKDSEIQQQRQDEGLKIHKYLQSVHKFKLRLHLVFFIP